jgi:hypothetical protein
LIRIVLIWRCTWTVTAEARFWWRASPCEIGGEQSGNGTGFSPSASVFSCKCHAASTPNSPLNTVLIRKTRGRTLGTFKAPLGRPFDEFFLWK